MAATPRTTTSPGLRLAKATRGDGRRRHLPLGPQDISSRGAPEQNRKVRMPTGIWNAATRFQTLHGPQHLQPQWRLVWHLVWLVWPPIGEDFLYWRSSAPSARETRPGEAPRWGPRAFGPGADAHPTAPHRNTTTHKKRTPDSVIETSSPPSRRPFAGASGRSSRPVKPQLPAGSG